MSTSFVSCKERKCRTICTASVHVSLANADTIMQIRIRPDTLGVTQGCHGSKDDVDSSYAVYVPLARLNMLMSVLKFVRTVINSRAGRQPRAASLLES